MIIIFSLLAVLLQCFAFSFVVGIAGPFLEDTETPNLLSKSLEIVSTITLWIAIWPSKILGIGDFFGLGFKINVLGWNFIGLIVGLIFLMLQKQKSDASN